MTIQTEPARDDQRSPRASRVSEQRFHEAVPSVGAPARIRGVAREQTREIATGALRRLPGLGSIGNRARTQPLRSSSVRMYRWWKAPFGSEEKPSSLETIPWDYVEANQDRVPFLGLREYWYPALLSRDVRHNQPKPMTILGDNLVFFRDGQGHVRALQNQCPHRNALLSLGQVGVFEPGTITCRYHGMTFDGSGECVAFLADGPNSAVCGRVRARSYAVEEHNGIVFVYMGDRDPEPFFDTMPHAASVVGKGKVFIHRIALNYSHLNMLDNTVDLTHVGCLHRTCLLFAGQQPDSEPVGYEELDGGWGLKAYFKAPIDHPGKMHIDDVEWYLPNLIRHPEGTGGFFTGGGWFWFVPTDVGSFTGWMIGNYGESLGPVRRAVKARLTRFLMGRAFGHDFFWPGSFMSCLQGGDAVMQSSQGRVVRWDREHVTATDRAVVKARRMLQDAHKAEVAERAARQEGSKLERIRGPQEAGR